MIIIMTTKIKKSKFYAFKKKYLFQIEFISSFKIKLKIINVKISFPF